MNDFDKIFWGFIFSTIAIGIGWFLNQASQWFRSRHEDKKSLKQVYYYLLETYHLFLKSDFDSYTKFITDKAVQKLSKEQQIEKEKIFLNKMFSDISTDVLKPELHQDLKKIQENFKVSITLLSSIDPITAFYLSDKTSFLDRFEMIDQLFVKLKETYPGEASEIDIGTKKVMAILKPTLLAEELQILEKDIIKIAWKINPVIWYKTKKTFKQIKKNGNKKISQKLDSIMEKLLPT